MATASSIPPPGAPLPRVSHQLPVTMLDVQALDRRIDGQQRCAFEPGAVPSIAQHSDRSRSNTQPYVSCNDRACDHSGLVRAVIEARLPRGTAGVLPPKILKTRGFPHYTETGGSRRMRGGAIRNKLPAHQVVLGKPGL